MIRRRWLYALLITWVLMLPGTALALTEGDPGESIPLPEEKPSFLESSVAYTINGLSEGLKLLGFKEVHQLVFLQSEEDEQVSTVWGIFTEKDMREIIKPWHNSFRGLAWGLTVLALLLGGARMAGSAINPARRVGAIAMIQNWLIASFLLTFSLFIFDFLFGINNALLNDLALTGNTFSFTEFPSGQNQEVTLAQALIKLVAMGLTIWINFIYVARKYALMVLVILAPVFCHFWYYQKTRSLTGLWFKEVLSNITMQIVHGFMLALFFSLNSGESQNWLVKLGFLLIFIPTSDMVRRLISGTGGGHGPMGGAVMGLGLGSMIGLAALAGRGARTLSGGSGGALAETVRTSHPAFQGLNVTRGSSGVDLMRTVAGKAGSLVGRAVGTSIGAGLGNPVLAKSFGDLGSQVGGGLAAAGGGVLGAGMSVAKNGLKVEPGVTGSQAWKVRAHNLAHLTGQAVAGDKGARVASQLAANTYGALTRGHGSRRPETAGENHGEKFNRNKDEHNYTGGVKNYGPRPPGPVKGGPGPSAPGYGGGYDSNRKAGEQPESRPKTYGSNVFRGLR